MKDPAGATWGAGAGPAPAEPMVEDGLVLLNPIGQGGMGELHRVHDRRLGRVLVRKTVRPDLAESELTARFLREARLAAGLEHPAIPPVHQLGELPDGRPYFTMREVKGRTLAELVREHHDLRGALPHRLLEVCLRVAEAVAYAHDRGVIHRDIKPQNIMVGGYGEALLLDWGLARRFDRDGFSEGQEPETGPALTRHGVALGTPAYAPPEQLRGDLDLVGPPADVYALGAVIYEVLCGRPPFTGGSSMAVARAVLSGPPIALTSRCPWPLPDELVDIVETAMEREPSRRFPQGGAMAAALRAWRDGESRRSRARQIASRASERLARVPELRAEGSRWKAESEALLKAVETWAPAELKRAAWELEDRARTLQLQAEQEEAEAVLQLEAALSHDPDLDEAHCALADLCQAQMAEAEERKDLTAVARLEARLRHHDRGAHQAWLRGDGLLDLQTEPPCAQILLERYEERDRRMVPRLLQDLGPGPIQGLRLPRGSYRLRLRSPGCAEVLYPFALGRLERWELRRPARGWVGEAGGAPAPVPLPPAGELGPEDCYVPAGWAWLGGDELAISSLPRQRRWVEGFIMRRHPVTNAEFIEFLDDLVVQGREAEALEMCPRPALSGESQGARPVYGRRPDGGFALVPDEDGDVWEPRWPALLVNRQGVVAYARWLAERTGLPWRLPLEVEWEKAARGVDARSYPFGEHLDPSFCAMELSHQGKALPFSVDAFPLDESPFAIRGMGGNIRQWVLDRWRREGPGPGEQSPQDAPQKAVSRGGGWLGDRRWTRSASRGWLLDHQRTWDLGFRLCRSWPPRAEEPVVE